jgi:transcriptional regulator with XRE-family HTH domain
MSKRKRYRSSEWPGLLEQWSRTGEPAERFAAKLGISVVTLSRWQRRLSEAKPSTAVVEAATRSKAEASRSLFTPVQVVRGPRAEAGGVIEVVTRAGCMVRVHGLVDEETLASVFAAVGGC